MIEWIKDVKESFFSEVEKRLRNPFLGAFLISWIFWNWDFLYVSLFLDEKYVSLMPEIWNKFSTKFEYIKYNNLVNISKWIIYPLFSTFIVILFTEWWTTWLNIFILKIKNKILWFEVLTKEESLKLKNDLVDSKHKTNDLLSKKNDEILLLNSKISNLEFNIDNEVTNKIKTIEDKNLKRIEELEDNLSKSEIISSERLDKNIKLESELIFFKDNFENLKSSEKVHLNKIQVLNVELWKLKSQNNELLIQLEKLDKPLEDTYELDYKDFKTSYIFEWFEDFIDSIESNPYNLLSKFYWKDIKFLELKWIIEKLENRDWNEFYRFTNKWNKFVEYFLDEYQWNSKKEKPVESIDIDDIPF